MKKISLFVFICLFFACKKEKNENLSELQTNKIKWEQWNLNDYSYTFGISCFCPYEVTLPRQIQVEEGSVVSVNGEPYNTDIHWGVFTISDLFDRVDQAQQSNAFVVEVEYHKKRGYPIEIYIDENEMIADEEIGYSVYNLSD